MTCFGSSRCPRSVDCPLIVAGRRGDLSPPVCRLTDCHTTAAIEFCAESCRLIGVETFDHRIISAPTRFHLAAVSSSVAQLRDRHALRERLPALEVFYGRVAADGGVGHRSAVRCCSLTVAP